MTHDPDEEAERIEAERIRQRDEYLLTERRAGCEARWAKMDEAQLRAERMEVKARPDVERWFVESYPDVPEGPSLR